MDNSSLTTVPDTSVDPLMRVLSQLQSNESNDLDQAIAELQHIAVNGPPNGLALMGLGIGCARKAQWANAERFFKQAIEADPKLASAHLNLGNLLRHQDQKGAARAAYLKAIEIQPNLPEAHYNLSVLLDEEGKAEDAEVSIRRALLFKPDYPEAHNNLGHLLIKSGKIEQAVSHFRQALVWAPDMLQARFNLVLGLYRLGRSQEAQQEVDLVLSKDPNNTQVLRVQAAGLIQLGHLDDADSVNQKLLALQPDAPDILLSHADACLLREDFDGARSIYQNLISKRLVPPAVGLGAMANLMRAQAHYSEARNLYQQAMMMDNRLPILVMGLARTLLEAGDLKQALAAWHGAVNLLPDAADVHSGLLVAMRLDPDSTLEGLQAEAKRWALLHAQASRDHTGSDRHKQHIDVESLRIGFLLGTDVCGVVAPSLQAILNHKSDKTELFFYRGDMSRRMQYLAHHLGAHWRPVATLGTTDLAEQIRQDAVDFLIDTVGHHPGNRLPVFAHHAAPVQLHWLGDFSQPSTCLADLPYIWAAPSDAPAVCSLNTSATLIGLVSPIAQINGAVLDALATVMNRLPEAQLCIFSRLSAQDDATRQKLIRLLMIREVEPERVQFQHFSNEAERLGQLGRMRLVLDTFPVPMPIASAMECLWMGVPVVTFANSPIWTRTTSDLLGRLGMEEWITSDPIQYIERAVVLAQSLPELEIWRNTARDKLQSTTMMNPAGFAHAFEQCLLGRVNTNSQRR